MLEVLGPFQRTTIIVAITILIILLAVIAYLLYKSASEATWPPSTGNCPDYWADTTGDGSACTNPFRLGNPAAGGLSQPRDFRIQGQATQACKTSELMTKSYGLTWDGITNVDACSDWYKNKMAKQGIKIA